MRWVAGLAVAGSALAAPANAFPDPDLKGCDTTPTGSLIDQRGYLTICDGPIQADGSWTRKRSLWGESPRVCMPTPLGFRRCVDVDAPIHVYHSTEYRVTPDSIPPGEPGYIE